MKKTLATLALYVYNNYIYEDWSIYTKLGKICIYPFWVIRTLYVIIASPILSLGYYWENSKTYKLIEQARLESMVMMDQMYNKK
jgi:hypothetical protein